MIPQAIDPITADQIKALQTLYAQWQRHGFDEQSDPRAARLAWASENTGRNISSFSNLTRDEARILIDFLKGSMGQPVGQRPQPWRRINSRERAQAAGTAGRRGKEPPFIQLAGPDDLARIEYLCNQLEWTEEQFSAWLRSPRSPLGSTGQLEIRTVAQANRICWALKAMLVRAGRWNASHARRAARGGSKTAKSPGAATSRARAAMESA